MRAAKRDVTSYRSEIADLNAEKRRLDKRLQEFDESYEDQAKSTRGLSGIPVCWLFAGCREKAEMRDRQIHERKHLDERFELQGKSRR